MRLELSTCQLTGIDENGFVAAQIDALGSGGDDESGATPDQLSHAFGFVSRPKDPEKGVGCTLFHHQAGSSERHCWLGDDPRYVAKYPPPKKGGSCQYGADGVFSNIDPETHTWTLYVPYTDGKAHLITAGKDGNGDPIVEFVHGDVPPAENPLFPTVETLTTCFADYTHVLRSSCYRHAVVVARLNDAGDFTGAWVALASLLAHAPGQSVCNVCLMPTVPDIEDY